MLTENPDLETVVKDLSAINAKLMNPLHGTSEHEIALKALADRSHVISGELQGILGKLQVEKGSSGIRSIRKAVQIAYNKQGIANRMRTLDQYRLQILARLVTILKWVL